MPASWRDMTREHLRPVSLDYKVVLTQIRGRTRMSPRTLCVELDVAVLESRCAVLKFQATTLRRHRLNWLKSCSAAKNST